MVIIDMRRRDRYYYPAVFSYEKKGISVVFPDLDCATCGDTDEDAFVSAQELLGCVLLGVDVFMPAVRSVSKTKWVKSYKGEKTG